MVFLNAIQGVLSITIMIGIGYYLSYKGWFDKNAVALLTRLTINVSVPAYMFSNFMGSYTKEKLLEFISGVGVPFLTIITCYLTGFIISKIAKFSDNRKGTFCSMFGLSNSVLVGLPVNLALFGEASMPYALIYFMANTTTFWTLGTYGIRRDGDCGHAPLFSLENTKKIFSPPLLGFLGAVLMVLLGVTFPKGIMDTLKYLGNLTTGLSMLIIGMIIYSVDFKSIKLDIGVVLVLIGRVIVSPLIVILVCKWLPLPILMKKVFVIQSAMPVMTQTSLIAKSYNADYEYAALVTAVTTIASLISIPVYMVLLNTSLIF